ncbi:Hypothetical protein A7982_03713 [Minicystis rosea]|nr:Hypothetical protein A7982_03713 [Minicystis rosea]
MRAARERVGIGVVHRSPGYPEEPRPAHERDEERRRFENAMTRVGRGLTRGKRLRQIA